MGEFELIDRFFKRPSPSADVPLEGAPHSTASLGRVSLGIGDDCALLQPAPGMQLAVSTDLLIEGRHFLSTVPPDRLGHKCLAVNLSDLAASGARPLAFTLALALPRADEAWLAPFARGLLSLADAHGCELVGGDTTRGPLAICITVFGEVPTWQALLRSGARPGDELWASGTLGDARLALDVLRGTRHLPAADFEAARMRLEQPSPRVALGLALRGVASAAIDVSDGLMGDLGHVLRASGVGATLQAGAAATLLACNAVAALDERLSLALAGGDDYELLFTAPASQHDAVLAAARASGTRVTHIGRIDAEPGLRLLDADGRAMDTARYASFDHFA